MVVGLEIILLTNHDIGVYDITELALDFVIDFLLCIFLTSIQR